MVVLATVKVPETAFGEDFKAKKREEGEEKKDDIVVPATPLGLRHFNHEYRQDGAAGLRTAFPLPTSFASV